jgi:predicted nuclease with TOPRIM domain
MERTRLSMDDENSRLQSKLALQDNRIRRMETENGDIDEVLTKLETEQQNSESLRQLNQILREQLDQCNKDNIRLGDNVKRLKDELAEAHNECERLRDEKMQISGNN